MFARFVTSRRTAGEAHDPPAARAPAPRPLADGAPPHEAGERLPIETVRVSMRRVVAAWGFGAAFFNLTAGAIYTSFVWRIGADERVLGLLFAALPLMSFLQVISA